MWAPFQDFLSPSHAQVTLDPRLPFKAMVHLGPMLKPIKTGFPVVWWQQGTRAVP